MSDNYIHNTDVDLDARYIIEDAAYETSFLPGFQSDKFSKTKKLQESSIGENENISDYSITADGIIEEEWSKIENIQSRVIEVNDKFVTVECLIHIEKRIFENRTIPIELLTGIVDLTTNSYLLIKIFSRPGEVKHKFLDGRGGIVDKSYFNNDYFNNLDSKRLTRKY